MVLELIVDIEPARAYAFVKRDSKIPDSINEYAIMEMIDDPNEDN